jgi:hypothetical protein
MEKCDIFRALNTLKTVVNSQAYHYYDNCIAIRITVMPLTEATKGGPLQ